MVSGNSLDKKYDNALEHGRDDTILCKFSKLNQNYLTLAISESEFESLDDIQKQGGNRQKQSHFLISLFIDGNISHKRILVEFLYIYKKMVNNN